MAVVSKFSIKRQTKSISLPCKSHPTTFEIEELLNKITTTEAEPASAEAICRGLSMLTNLYKCMNDLLTSSTTHVSMSSEQNRKWVDELVDELVKFLDIGGNISDMLLEIKNHSRDLLFALRRRKGELNTENNVTIYNCFRKKMRKDVKGLAGSLKQVDNMITSGGLVVIDSNNHHLAALIVAVTGVAEMTILIFGSLLLYLSAPVSKPSRWSLVVSKLIHKGMAATEDHKEQGVVNEFESIDVALRILCKCRFPSETRNVQIAQSRLERLGAQIESLESGLECIFRCLVQTRVSLLNIISQ